jgi:hypothetical protein
MTTQVRRVVTGHDENGNPVVVNDERLTAVSRRAGAGISGCRHNVPDYRICGRPREIQTPYRDCGLRGCAAGHD